MNGRTMGAREWALILLLSVLWGGSFFFVEVALRDLSPLSVVTARVGFGAVALLMFVRLRGETMPTAWRDWMLFLVMGGLNNVIPFTLIAWAQTTIPSGLAAILNATTPLFTVILAHVLTTDERMTAGRLTGVLVGLAGVAVLIGPQALHGFDIRDLAQLAVLGGAASYALAGLYGRRLKGYSSPVAAAGMLTGATLFLAPLTLLLERPFGWDVTMQSGLAILGLGLLSTALAYLIYFRVLAAAGATNLLLVTFLIPVTALTLGIFFLGEAPSWTAYSGMSLIFLGLAAVDGRTFQCVAGIFRRVAARRS